MYKLAFHECEVVIFRNTLYTLTLLYSINVKVTVIQCIQQLFSPNQKIFIKNIIKYVLTAIK